MNLTVIPSIIAYVIDAPFFWGSMGFTTAIAMFIGAIIHNGDLTQLRKTIISMSGYLFILVQVTVTRIIDTYSDSILAINQVKHPEMAFAGLTTIIFLTIFWGIGLFLGVWMLRFKQKRTLKIC